MNILITDKFVNTKVLLNVKHIPRIGESINMGYKPFPRIKEVIWYPDKATMDTIKNITTEEITVLLLVE